MGSQTHIRLGMVSKREDPILLNHVFKIKAETLPDYMIEQFVPASSVHSYSTSFTDIGSFPFQKLSFGKKSFVYWGCTIWNDLTNRIKQIQCFQTFKNAVRAHVLDIRFT